MSIISRMRRQRAVYWEQNGIDRFGKLSFNEPVEIKCRWDDGNQDLRTPQGQSIMFNSVVYVDREMKIGDMLMKGELESGTDNDPHKEPEAKSIQRFNINPNLRNTENIYTAFL